jgi:predicted homoserine dehydrogenase-like protein
MEKAATWRGEDHARGYFDWEAWPPAALAHHVKLVRPVAKGQLVTWADVEVDPKDVTVAFQREVEKAVPPKK